MRLLVLPNTAARRNRYLLYTGVCYMCAIYTHCVICVLYTRVMLYVCYMHALCYMCDIYTRRQMCITRSKLYIQYIVNTGI